MQVPAKPYLRFRGVGRGLWNEEWDLEGGQLRSLKHLVS